MIKNGIKTQKFQGHKYRKRAAATNGTSIGIVVKKGFSRSHAYDVHESVYSNPVSQETKAPKVVYTGSPDSADVAKLMEKFHFDPDKRNSILAKYER